jgi:hypothetical protein
MFRSFQAIVFNRLEQKLRILLTQTVLFFSVLISESRNREKVPISNALAEKFKKNRIFKGPRVYI